MSTFSFFIIMKHWVATVLHGSRKCAWWALDLPAMLSPAQSHEVALRWGGFSGELSVWGRTFSLKFWKWCGGDMISWRSFPDTTYEWGWDDSQSKSKLCFRLRDDQNLTVKLEKWHLNNCMQKSKDFSWVWSCNSITADWGAHRPQWWTLNPRWICWVDLSLSRSLT